MHRVGTAATAVVALLSGLVANTTTGAANAAMYPADRMGRALLTSSTNTLAAPCTSGEYEACYADPSCKACDEVVGASWETCFDRTSQSTAFALQGDCDVLMERMCCSIADGDDCYNNALFSDLHACYFGNCGYTSDFLFSDECPDASTSPRSFSAAPLATAEGTGAVLILAGATSNVLRQLFFR